MTSLGVGFTVALGCIIGSAVLGAPLIEAVAAAVVYGGLIGLVVYSWQWALR